ncbi:hypothetical protein CFIMG_000857RA [Ceratocystis fimbriata CBS 114723]|uniref:Copper acquisition factor BIM1-like domain-containing protein n=1 Tax=Ceratocystis fimbriata CBS 114723 TaxID=1035309 RepID=A0A2C5XGA9_9PEZI|nr:hypothetical protein CFIMG_000857RA [Ceratocystis fimbriata CBS 114723]
MKSFFALFALSSLALAHFDLEYPDSVDGNDNAMDQAPCGGATISFTDDADDVTDFFVGGDAIALTPTHPRQNWLFRATLDKTASGNWTQIYPIFEQSELGTICMPSVTVPDEWAGQQGVISVAASASDGLLFSCALVRFVSGTSTRTPEDCRNTTTSLSFSNDSTLSALVDNNASSSNSSSGASSTGSSSSTNSNSGSTSTSSPSSDGVSLLGQSFGMMISASVGALLVAVTLV